MRYDSIIIGAGMSGLAAGIRLALLGRRSVVLERHEIWGGLNSFYSLEGHKFDVGLHALTNYAPAGSAGTVLTRLLRRLDLDHPDLALGEQGFSQILLPGLRLTFTNDFAHFEEEVGRAFPAERDGFAALVRRIGETKLGPGITSFASGRSVLTEHLRDPLLIESLLLPTCFYGSAIEDDVDWTLFTVLFRGIFLEGLAHPAGGIRTLLNLLVKKLKSAGGEIRTRAGVRRILLRDGAAAGVELEDGTVLETDHVLSCAGYPETMRLCDATPAEALPGTPAEVPAPRKDETDVGRLSFQESISVVDRRPRELGLEAATSFFCTEERFRWRRPDDLTDPCSGAISVADNFTTDPPPPEGTVRLSTLANHDRWQALDDDAYARAKTARSDAAITTAIETYGEHLGDWRGAEVFRDVFTPKTIHRFTRRLGGAIYGSPVKRAGGDTPVAGVHLCGADQGWPGVIGALASGVEMATRHAAARAGRRRG